MKYNMLKIYSDKINSVIYGVSKLEIKNKKKLSLLLDKLVEVDELITDLMQDELIQLIKNK